MLKNNAVSLHQADIWAFKIYTEASKILKSSNEKFDAMLFIESKEVQAILPIIVESLNQKFEQQLSDINDNKHFANALQSLTKSVIEVYGQSDNGISKAVETHGHDTLKEQFSKSKELTLKFSSYNSRKEKEDLTLTP